MYEIYIDNKSIARISKPVYVKKHAANSGYTPCSESEAEGISVKGAGVYALAGKELDGLPKAVIVEIDDGEMIDEIVGRLNAEIERVTEEADIEKDDTLRGIAIKETKKWLRRELKKGMTWRDGGRYSITEEKRRYMAAELLGGVLKILEGTNPEDVTVMWNESGAARTEWRYEDLRALWEDVDAYVNALVVRQQRAEEKIAAASDDDDIRQIVSEFM